MAITLIIALTRSQNAANALIPVMIRCARSSSRQLRLLQTRRVNRPNIIREINGVALHNNKSSPKICSIPTNHITIRSSSVFSGWGDKEWHRSDFLFEATVKQKEGWLETMLTHHGNAVDVEAFLVVFGALASPLQDAGAPRRAEHWISRLKNHRGLQPTAECYQAVIQAWANSSKENILVVVNRAERWLNELIAESEKSPEKIQPTIECFNAFLDACTRGRSGRNKRNQSIVVKNAIKAEAILRQLNSHYHHFGEEAKVTPNTETFNYVIRGWTRCRHDQIVAKKVLALLRLMEAYQRNNPTCSKVLPNTKSYSMAMDALIAVAKMKARDCLLDGGSFHGNRSHNGIAELEEAQAILAYMHDLHDAGVEGVVPHRIPYNILITGWSSLAAYGHENAPFKAEEIVRTMLSHKDSGFVDAAPDRISFEKVMTAWANSGHPNAGKRASWWLKKLWNDSELDGNANLLPTKKSYNIVMKALAEAEGALAAENLLLELGDKYKEEKESDLCPNSESFAIVIRAWLRKAEQDSSTSERVESLSRAVEWLTSLREVENERNLSTSPELFVGALRVATRCAIQRRDTLKLATDTFHALKESRFQMDTVPYSLMLQVGLGAFSGPDDKEEREAFVHGLFSDICEEGFLSNMFVQTLAQSRTFQTGWTTEECKELTNELFPEWPLPTSWSRNLSNPRHHPKESDTVQY